LSRLTPYAEEIIGDQQCGFRHNRSTTDHIFIIRQILKKKWEYNEAVHQLFIDFKKAYDSLRREVLYNILIEFGIPMKLVKLIKMCLSETCNRVRVAKHLSDTFPIKNALKQGAGLSPLIFNFSLEYTIRRVQTNQEGLQLNGTDQLLVYADDVNMLGGSVHSIKKNAEDLMIASKEICLEVNGEKTKYMIMSRNQNAGHRHNINVDNKSFERVEEFKYLGATLTNRKCIHEEIKSRLKSGNACYHSVQNLLSPRLLSNNKKIRVYRSIILPVFLYGCETWSVTLRKEQRLRVFENRVLRRIFGPKRGAATGDWRRLHNEELNDLYSSPNIIWVMKSKRMRWAGHVARMVEKRGGDRILVGRPEGRRPVGRPRSRWEDNIKMDLEEVRWGHELD
jgi:sorting nexin-29